MSPEKPKDGSMDEKSTCLTGDRTDSRSRCLNGQTSQATLRTEDLQEIMPLKCTINLDLLSEELQRQTKETLKLKEEVEQATRLTLQRMGYKVSNTEMSANQVCATRTSQEYGILSHQSFICPVHCGVDVNGARSPSFAGQDVLEPVIKEYSVHVLDLQRQLRESCELRDQQKLHFQQSIVALQGKLQESQIERNTLNDLRIKGSQKESELTGQLEAAVKELHVLKQTEGQKLIKAEDKLKTFSRRADNVEQMLQDVYKRLSDYERRTGRTCYLCCDGDFTPDQLPLGLPVEKALRDLENENHSLQMRLQLMEEQLKTLEEKRQGMTESFLKEQKENCPSFTMAQLITSPDQQVEMLTGKLTSSQAQAQTLQLEELQKPTECLTPLNQPQINDLESAIFRFPSDLPENQEMHEAKVRVLEEALVRAQSRAKQAERERDLSQHQAEELDGQICRLRTELYQTAEELSVKRQQFMEKDMNQSLTIQNLRQELEQCGQKVQQLESIVQSLRGQCQRHQHMQMSAETKQQEAFKELAQLHKEVQSLQQAKDKAMQLHEQSVFEAKQLKALLEVQQQEAQQAWTRLGEEQVLMQGLQAEVEVLKLKLEDGEKYTCLLMGPLETLQQDKSSLSKQLKQLQLDNQQLRTVLHEAELRLSVAEQEKLQQQAALSEGTRSLQQLGLEKQQVTAELEMQRSKLLQLKEEQEVLREQHSRKREELQEQNSRLKVELHNIRNDLEQAKISLRALGCADGHGLKVALGMQEQITAKREQVDFLQSRVQMLEETTEKLAQEKRYQVMKSKRQEQELIFERERRRRLETELKAQRTNEKHLKSKAEKLDTALHKMSDAFAECQEFIQKQEQEIMRLKLQHALELKEGQNLQAPKARSCEPNQSIVQRSFNSSPTLPAQIPVVIPECNFSSQKCCPTPEAQSLMKHLHTAFSEEHIPYSSLSICRSKQTDRRMFESDLGCKVTKNRDGVNDRTRPSSSYSEQGPLPATDIYKQDVISAFSPESRCNMKEQDEQQGQLESLQGIVEHLQIKNRGRSKAESSLSQNCLPMIKIQERKIKQGKKHLKREVSEVSAK